MEELNTHLAKAPNGDSEFDDILRQMSESLNRGDKILIDTWCKRFPQYEERLRRAFPGLLIPWIEYRVFCVAWPGFYSFTLEANAFVKSIWDQSQVFAARGCGPFAHSISEMVVKTNDSAAIELQFHQLTKKKTVQFMRR